MSAQTDDNDTVLLVRGSDEHYQDIYEIYDDKNDVWYPYIPADEFKKWKDGTVLCHTGKYFYTVHYDENGVATLDIFDLELQTTKTLSSIPSPETYAAVVDDSLYYVSKDKDPREEDIIRYNISDNTWTKVARFNLEVPLPVFAEPLIPYKGIIYGFRKYLVRTFNVETQQINYLENLPHHPEFITAASIDEKIYILPVDRRTGDMLVFTPGNDRWENLKPTCYSPVYNFCNVLTHKGKLLSLGRYCDIHEYDPAKNTWDFLCKVYSGDIIRFRQAYSVNRDILRNYMK